MSETVIKPLLYGVDFDAQTRVLSFKRKDGAEIYSCTIPESGLVDDVTKPLMFRAISDNSSVTLNAVGSYAGTFKTSTDAETWENYVLGTEIPLNADDCVYFKVDDFSTKTNSAYCQFSMTGTIEAWHNVNSMASGNFASLTDLSSFGDFALRNLFGACVSLVKAPLLPATTLAPYCYFYMFGGCSGLSQPPALPATVLATYCYSQMLLGCSGLTSAPALPATTLAQSCYSSMLKNCIGITQPPALPATTLAQSCYGQMFEGCSGLTSAPALSATTLAQGCYSGMFEGCRGLTRTPELPATTLEQGSYSMMFANCSSLNEVTCYATDISANGCTRQWLNGVAATGNFYTPQSTEWGSGISGIPTNWTRHDL